MPNPAFVPVIGGGFDQVAGQQYNWANYNRAVEEDNLRRQDAANAAYNNWLLQNTELGWKNAHYLDEMGRLEEATRYNRYLGGLQSREQIRQFDVGAAIGREQIAANKAAIEAQNAERKRLEDEGKKTLANLAQSMVPGVKAAGKEYVAAEEDFQKAANTFNALPNELITEHGLPTDIIVYNPQRNEFVTRNKYAQIPTEWTAKVAQANQALREGLSDLQFAKQHHTERTSAWNLAQTRAYQNGLTIEGRGEKAYVYSPALDKKFGELVEEAKKETPAAEPTAFVPSAPSFFGPAPTYDLSGGFQATDTGTTPSAPVVPSGFAPIAPIYPATGTTAPPPVVAPASAPVVTPGPMGQFAGGPPPAPRLANDRKYGIVYMTPRGPMRWVGIGWAAPD